MAESIRLFLCGDVMTGRGIDQVLPHSVDPHLAEPAVASAETYVALAERASGPIPRPVDFAYVWGEALAELERAAPDLGIVNLETAVTTSEDLLPKGINYRMHPGNVGVLTAAGIDACVLANNHVLDWGAAGLAETVETLQAAGLAAAGAGADAAAAWAPAVLQAPGGGRVLLFAMGAGSSGIPRDWAAGADAPGVARLDDLSGRTLEAVAARIAAVRRPGDLVVASIHWGGNWGYEVADEQRAFARGLVETAGVDAVHGHSSHHPKALEVHRERPILYGCGDFLNDYEGIGGHEEFRDDLVLMYLPEHAPASGRLMRLRMVPLRIRRFSLERAAADDARWLAATLDRESRAFGTRVALDDEGALEAFW